MKIDRALDIQWMDLWMKFVTPWALVKANITRSHEAFKLARAFERERAM